MPSTRRSFLRATATLGAGATAGCVTLRLGDGPATVPPETVGTDWTPPAEVWAAPDGGPRATRYAPGAAGPTGPDLAWRRDATREEFGASLAVGAATAETAYLQQARSADEHALVAVDAADGEERWRTDPGTLSYGPVLSGETLYRSGGDRYVEAIDAADGSRRWRRDLRATLREALGRGNVPDDLGVTVPVATPDAVYVPSEHGLHGLDPADGSERWRVELDDGSFIGGCRTVGSDAAFPAETGGTVYAVTPERPGVPVVHSESFVSAPALAAGRLSITAVGQHEAIYDALAWSIPAASVLSLASAGAEPVDVGSVEGEWAFERPADVRTRATVEPAADGDRVYVAETAAVGSRLLVTVFGLAAADGTIDWRYDVEIGSLAGVHDPDVDPLVTRPAVGAGAVYVGVTTAPSGGATTGVDEPTAGRVVALDRTSGAVQWTAPVDFAPARVVVAGDRLFAWSADGRLAAFE